MIATKLKQRKSRMLANQCCVLNEIAAAIGVIVEGGTGAASCQPPRRMLASCERGKCIGAVS